jgi:electron transport complex protein RnfG
MAEQKGFLSMAKLGIVLALYSAVACVGLAFVYSGTAEIIASRQQADLEAALKELFPDADSFIPIAHISSPNPLVTFEGDANNTGAFQVIKNNNTVGVALRTSIGGFSVPLKILVGVSANGSITGIKVLENTDTPGLGANAGSVKYYIDRSRGIHFYDQFAGKAVTDAFVAKQDVVAITAATITSNAVSASVKAAGTAAMEWMRAVGGIR